jgi:hypothetical protein
MRTASLPLLLLLPAMLGGAGCASLGGRVPGPEEAKARAGVIARAEVWQPTRVEAMNLRRGPTGRGAFRPGATITCTYRDKDLAGRSPKFVCAIGGGDEVKVKYGAENGEVYGEVLATRLLWALGFGADRMYPVTVICRGCPEDLGGTRTPRGAMRFDPAVIERKMPGAEWAPEGREGWAWNELNVVNASAGGAPRAHRDALKLLAVMLQHTDSKPQQQRVVCLDQRSAKDGTCRRPFLMINDLGLTFGRANAMNRNAAGSVNLAAWRETPVWKDETGCTGYLPRSLTGSLEHPVIGEDGRRFLARLLARLSDRQLRDLFDVAQVRRRPRSPGDASSGYPSVAEWVGAFKAKRAAIAERRCEPAPERVADRSPGGASSRPD